MKLFFKIFFAFIFFTLNILAQVKIKGNIKDALGNNLENVTVSAANAQTKEIITYFITDSGGNYDITLPNVTNVFIRASYIGYNSQEKIVLDKVFIYNFILLGGELKLTEVKVKAQNLLIQNGDTLNYNVKKFSKSQDRTIGDVIKNLPGITVNSAGTISYNGQPINKFYIDGDDLLGEKYALASNSIPLDAVDAVQVLENHQPIKMLKNKVFSDNGALNIKLKESAKLRVFGTGNVSVGIPSYVGEARANALAFKSKIKFINTYAFNNIGGDLNAEVQTQNTNALGVKPANNNANDLLGFTSLPNPPLPTKYYINNVSQLAALNILIPICKIKSIRFNFYWLPNKIVTDTKGTNTFYLQNDTIKQYENQINFLKRKDLFFGSTYLINSNELYLQNQFSLASDISDGNGYIENERTSFWQQLDRNNRRVQNAFLLKRAHQKYLIELSSNFKYSTNPENLSIGYGIYPWLLNNGVNFKIAEQNAKQYAISSNTTFSMSKQNEKITTGLNAEYFLESINYRTGIAITQENNDIRTIDKIFSNNFKWFQQSIKFGPAVNFNTKKINLSFNFPFILRDVNYDDKILTEKTSVDRFSFHPQLKINVEIGNYLKIIFTGKRETNIPESQNLLFGGILHSYRILSQNEQQFQFGNSNTFSFNFAYRNPIKITFFNTAVIYSRDYLPTISSSIFDLGLIQIKQQNFDNLSNRLLILSNFSKYIFPIKTTIKGNYSRTALDYNQVQNNFATKFKSVSNSFSATVNTKPVWYFNMDLSMNYLTSTTRNVSEKKYIGGVNELINTNLQSTCNLRENFYIQVEINHLYQVSNGSSNKFILFDAKVNFTIKKTKTDVGLKAINIFNEDRFIIRDTNGSQVSANDYWLRPLTILLNFSFRF